MIQLAREDAMPSPVTRQEDHVASGKSAGQEIIGRFAERRFDFRPFLFGKSFDVVETAAPDYADPIF
jgi:hypothetical protein